MFMLSLQRFRRLTLRFGLISLMTIVLVLSWGGISQSQLPALPSGAANSSFNPPAGVSRHGEYETAAIRSPLDGKELFEVTSPTILNRDKVPEGMLPVEVRAQAINERLWRVFNRTYVAKETPTVTIATLNNRPVIQISDDQASRPIRFITVTEPDADLSGKTLDELAAEWQKKLQEEVARFKQLAAPEVLAQRLRQAFQLLLGLLIASVLIWFLHRLLTRRQQTLEAQYEEQLATLTEAAKTPPADAVAEEETIAAETEERRLPIGDRTFWQPCSIALA